MAFCGSVAVSPVILKKKYKNNDCEKRLNFGSSIVTLLLVHFKPQRQ